MANTVEVVRSIKGRLYRDNDSNCLFVVDEGMIELWNLTLLLNKLPIGVKIDLVITSVGGTKS